MGGGEPLTHFIPSTFHPARCGGSRIKSLSLYHGCEGLPLPVLL